MVYRCLVIGVRNKAIRFCFDNESIEFVLDDLKNGFSGLNLNDYVNEFPKNGKILNIIEWMVEEWAI